MGAQVVLNLVIHEPVLDIKFSKFSGFERDFKLDQFPQTVDEI
jgi:hypothetical protein